ncbi:MAG: UDP-N-acetylglucosamine 2-epimerase (non-hydrolyzing) [Candidatus Melainabacteria bacterium]|nr:UDP-N-acetylglucosamine 2-epimerase (non-hydrolyzing) [Candidatus Melainabacteria bacterium]
MMKKIALVVGTRPEVIKLAPVYLELTKSKIFRPILINTGQHKEMTNQMLRWFGIKADVSLDLMKENQSLPSLTARVIEKVYSVLKKIKPKLVVVEGDTATVMAASIAAFYLKIPIAHVEAGLRTNNIYNPYPEEMARRLVSHLSTIHFAPTARAANNLRKENIKQNVFVTGNTVIDALFYTIRRTTDKGQRTSVFSKVDFKKHKVFLVTLHRRENFGKPHREIAKALIRILKEHKNVAILLPLHKNPKVRDVLKQVLKKHKRAFLFESLDYVPFVYAMKNCYLILTDSGGIQEEAPTLGKPVLVLRETTERPEGIKAGAAKLVGIDGNKIYKEVSKLLKDKKLYKKMAKAKNPYGDGKAAIKIRKILEKSCM